MASYPTITRLERELETERAKVRDLERDLDRARGREPDTAGPRDYMFAERIFAGWRERAERAEAELEAERALADRLAEALANIASRWASAEVVVDLDEGVFAAYRERRSEDG